MSMLHLIDMGFCGSEIEDAVESSVCVLSGANSCLECDEDYKKKCIADQEKAEKEC
ncbi:hypothetical protein J4403_00895 [Candidatus Woesearchaeota archaeon]|nr:hypothetical protein [Candidatus Woesearchaeota archaeon]